MSEQTSQSASQPSPALFLDTVNAYQRTAATKAAIELDLFKAIGEGADTADAIATRCKADPRGVRILSDLLAVAGFLTRSGKRYTLTQDSAIFLDPRSPAYLGGAVDFLLSPQLTDAFKDLTRAVRKGGTAMAHEGTLAPEHPVWVKFARAMAPMMAMPAEELAKLVLAGSNRPMKVLDISASHGVFGLAFARLNPNAQIVGLDWSNVLEVARQNAKKAGVESRYQTIAGSAFDADYGQDYDVVLLPNFLHHFDPQTCEKLLRRVRSALADNGQVATLEFVPDDERMSPPQAVSFSLTMLATTPHGDAYTFSEYRMMFKNAGFSRNELHSLPGGIHRAILSRR